MSITTETLGDALPREMARVRDEVLPIYLEFPTGIIAATLMRCALDDATRAMAEGDLAGMIVAYERLKEFEL
jgi:hypothetical protein